MKIMIPAFISLSIVCCVAILSSSCNSKEQKAEPAKPIYIKHIPRVPTTWDSVTGKLIVDKHFIDSIKLKEIQRSEYLSLGSDGFLLIRDDTVFFFNRKTETPTSKIPKSFFCE